MSKTSTIKSVQLEQFQLALQKPSVDFEAYPLAGYAPGNILRIPSHSSLGRWGSDHHPNWLDLSDFAPAKPMEVNGRYETSDGFGQIMDSMTCKDANLDRNGARINRDAFAGQHNAFAHTYFPVVFRLSPAFIKTTGLITNDYEKIVVVPFRVVASTWPWESNGSDMDYRPEYRMEPHIKDGIRINLYIDMRYLDDQDEHSYLSTLASVLSVLPSRWSQAISNDNVLEVYLTIAPAISNAHYYEFIDSCQKIMESNAPREEHCFRFTGASLGLAVLGAIMGMPPIMYTGMNSQMGVNAILGEGGIQEVALGANMVDEIDDFEYKSAAAIIIGVPLIIPLNQEWYGESAKKALYRGISLALGLGHGRNTLLALAGKQFGYPANMQKAIALANDSTNWAVNMNEFIYTTAKRAAGWDFNQLPSLVLAATNLSDVQILAAHAVAYVWNPTGSILVRRENNGSIAGKSESSALAKMKAETTRAYTLADRVGGVQDANLRGHTRVRAKIQVGPSDSDMFNTDKLFDGRGDSNTVPARPIVKRKVAPKRAGGRSGGTVKARGKAAGTKKKAPKKKKATKKKPKKKASSKKKGGKKKGKGNKKGKKKRPVGKAAGAILGSAAKKKNKKKKKKNKKGKKRPVGKASGSKKAKKAKKPKKAGKKKSKSKKSHKKKTSFGRSAGYRVLGTARRSTSAMSAKQIMQRALARARAGKK